MNSLESTQPFPNLPAPAPCHLPATASPPQELESTGYLWKLPEAKLACSLPHRAQHGTSAMRMMIEVKGPIFQLSRSPQDAKKAPGNGCSNRQAATCKLSLIPLACHVKLSFSCQRQEAGLLLKLVAPRRGLAAMETVLGQVEQLPVLLAVSRSPLVRDWDSLTLDRALEWARYFQHLHDRFRTRPRLREALGRRLRREGREAEAAGEAAARLQWLAGVLEQLPQSRAFEVVAAALLLLGQGSDAEKAGGRSREENSLDGNQASGTGAECVAELLLSWLLGNLERFSAFCLFLPGSLLGSLAGHYSRLSKPYLDLLTSWGSHLLYDPLQGRWVKSSLDKAELAWEELRERFCCLCQGSVLLRGQTQAALKLLKAQDGDFKVHGLSVWTDLLMEIEKYLRKEAEH
ncbi:PREDICTED: Fanconi anemia group F protein [Mesitornis unicolor]|uniref:Fanconi anemia group F protein n=1 Tax=Mesitornis unicolor TaxID=54374 RepID=UPI000528F778|nr:PREDICTED: Fanconi anemia group F protein [Mesitornis unicolor]